MTGKPGYPDGFVDLPQDHPVALDPCSRYALSSGRLDVGSMEADRTAFDVIDASVKAMSAMVWLLAGNRKDSQHFEKCLTDLIDEQFAGRRGDLAEAEGVLDNE